MSSHYELILNMQPPIVSENNSQTIFCFESQFQFKCIQPQLNIQWSHKQIVQFSFAFNIEYEDYSSLPMKLIFLSIPYFYLPDDIVMESIEESLTFSL